MSIEFPVPDGVTPHPGYAHVAVSSRAKTIYLAGQVGRDGEGLLVGEEDHEAQTAQAMRNVAAGLRSAGAGLQDIVQMTIHVVGLERPGVFEAVYAGLGVADDGDRTTLGRVPNTIVGTTALAVRGLLVEIAVIAAID